MKKIVISLGSILTLGLPMFVSAAPSPKLDSYLGDAISQGEQLLNSLVVFLFALAVVWFIWNVTKYAMSDEEDAKEKAKDQMIRGIIAIAVMASIWGIVAILRVAFGTDSSGGIPYDIYNMIPHTS